MNDFPEIVFISSKLEHFSLNFTGGLQPDVERKVESTPTLKYHCNECEFSSPSSKMLNRHMSKHSNVRPFKCEQCNKDFKAEWALIRHQKLKTCNRNEQYKCELCSFSTPEQNHLDNHMREEHEEIYVCSICGKHDILDKIKFSEHLRCHFPETEVDTPEASLTDDELFAKYKHPSIIYKQN